MRVCGTCTECCGGALALNVYGQEVSPGTPCRFMVKCGGCSIYEDRPVEPCSTYKCLWLSNEDVPDWLKPEVSGAIFDIRNIGTATCLFLSPCGENLIDNGYVKYLEGYDLDIISWGIEYAKSKNLDFAWYFRGKYFYVGSDHLKNEMIRTGLLIDYSDIIQ